MQWCDPCVYNLALQQRLWVYMVMELEKELLLLSFVPVNQYSPSMVNSSGDGWVGWRKLSSLGEALLGTCIEDWNSLPFYIFPDASVPNGNPEEMCCSCVYLWVSLEFKFFWKSHFFLLVLKENQVDLPVHISEEEQQFLWFLPGITLTFYPLFLWEIVLWAS